MLVITETFFNYKTSTDLFQIPGFDVIRRDRKTISGNRGGAILIYLNSDMNYKQRTDLEDSQLEIIWRQVCPFKSSRSLLFAGIYRPPNVNADYDNRLGKNIENVHLLNLETILLGDLNIDFASSNCTKHRLVKSLQDTKFTQLVISVTRPSSASSIDHIWSNKPEHIANVTTRDIYTSDHLPILGVRLYKRKLDENTKRHKYIVYRDYKHLDKKKSYKHSKRPCGTELSCLMTQRMLLTPGTSCL